MMETRDTRDTFWMGAMAAIGATVIGYILVYTFGARVMAANPLGLKVFEVWQNVTPRFCLIASLIFTILCVQILHWQGRQDSVRGAMAVGGLLVLVVLTWGLLE